MRTTLTIDDDIAAKLEELRRRKGLSLKKAVNLLLRRGLMAETQPPQAVPYRTTPRRLGIRPGFDPTKLNQLVDDLEAEDSARKL